MTNARVAVAQDGMAVPETPALLVSFAVIFVSVGLAFVPQVPGINVSLQASAGFTQFAAFYVAAQLIERFMEPVTWPLSRWGRTADEMKSNRTAVIFSLTLALSVIVSSLSGLHFLEAVGMTAPTFVDNFATGLIISGGTKPLHDFISYVQQSKDGKSQAVAKAREPQS